LRLRVIEVKTMPVSFGENNTRSNRLIINEMEMMKFPQAGEAACLYF
jgi:hypothetical protein